MTTTSNLSAIKQYDPTAATAATSSTSATSTKDLTQNFLKMLTAQLQNQDPMSPTDTGTMTTTLAQLNQVDAMNQMNSTMTSLLAQIQSNNFMSLANNVGKYAMAPGSTVNFDGTNSVNLGANFASDSSAAVATITDATGKTIQQYDLGANSAGMLDFAWDGTDASGNKVAAGKYSLSISSTTTSNTTETPAAYVDSQVLSIGKNGSAMQANLADGRSVDPTTINQWLVG